MLIEPKTDTSFTLATTATQRSPKPLVFESDHPYKNESHSFTPVAIKGATKLILTFDPRTRTENGCDHMIIFDENPTENASAKPIGDQLSGGI